MHEGFEIVDPQFARYTLFNARLETLASGCRWTEGPVWFGDANALLFSDIPNNRMLRWIEDVGVCVYRAPSHFTNGHTRDRQGRLISCSHGLRAVTRTEYDGTITLLADRYGDARLNSPNDVIVKSEARSGLRIRSTASRLTTKDCGHHRSFHAMCIDSIRTRAS